MTPSKTSDTNLDCAFVESTLVFIVLEISKALSPLDLPVSPLALPANADIQKCYLSPDTKTSLSLAAPEWE